MEQTDTCLCDWIGETRVTSHFACVLHGCFSDLSLGRSTVDPTAESPQIVLLKSQISMVRKMIQKWIVDARKHPSTHNNSKIMAWRQVLNFLMVET